MALTTGDTIIVVLTASYSDSVTIRHATLTCASRTIIYMTICSILGHWICWESMASDTLVPLLIALYENGDSSVLLLLCLLLLLLLRHESTWVVLLELAAYCIRHNLLMCILTIVWVIRHVTMFTPIYRKCFRLVSTIAVCLTILLL